MPVDCYQCGQPIDILLVPTGVPTAHFHGRCYSQFQQDQADEPPYQSSDPDSATQTEPAPSPEPQDRQMDL